MIIVSRRKKEKKECKGERKRKSLYYFQCVHAGPRILFHIFGFIYI